MYELNIKVRNKIAAQTDKAEYVCGNSDYIAVFDLDSEWDAYDTKTARFSYNGSYTDVVFDGNQCPVPVITNTHCFHIGVYAGDLHTTTAARVPCRKSILCGGGSHVAPSEDVYNQLMQRMSELETPDWNQNDSTKKDYIKNRTHWARHEVLDFGEHSFNNQIYSCDFALSIADGERVVLNKGMAATIVFDGQTYELTLLGVDDEGMACFGNPDLFESDDGIPFMFGINSNGRYIGFAVRDNEEHTFSASVDVNIVHQLDTIFCPGSITVINRDDGTPLKTVDGIPIKACENTSDNNGDIYYDVYLKTLRAKVPSTYPVRLKRVYQLPPANVGQETVWPTWVTAYDVKESRKSFATVVVIVVDGHEYEVPMSRIETFHQVIEGYTGMVAALNSRVYRVTCMLDDEYDANYDGRYNVTITTKRIL